MEMRELRLCLQRVRQVAWVESSFLDPSLTICAWSDAGWHLNLSLTQEGGASDILRGGCSWVEVGLV